MTIAAPARPYHHGNLRAAMVQSALALLEANGLGELSLRRAAREIGVSQTAPLYHFGNKLGLLVAVATEGFRRLLAHRQALLAGETSAHGRLRAAMLAYVEFGLANPALFRLMTGPEVRNRVHDADLEQAASEAFGLLHDCVADYLIDGDMSPDDSRRATLAAWATSHGIVTLLLDRQESPLVASRRPPREIAEEIVDILIAGLAALRPTPA
jgi:AcrR family transcriptional regulator